MNVERWLQVHLVILCLLGSLFVALSTENLLVPSGVLLAGITSVVFTDALRWLRLNRLLGNLGAVGAVLYSLRDFFRSGSDGQLLAIASLLVYLQVILFYQEKQSRLYWQMILLSLLQVVVGAALHLGLAFGVLLLVYTSVSVSTLVLFFIHRETELHSPGAAPVGPGLGHALPQRITDGEPWMSLLGGPATVHVDDSREEISRSFLSTALIRQIVMLTCGALLFAAAFFYFAPRHSRASWSGARGFSRPQTGFTREVELQQMGELLQNNSVVMKVKLGDQFDRPVRDIEPYLAGEALVEYRTDEEGHARWLAAASLHGRGAGSPPMAPREHTLVTVEMRATTDPALFAITPAYALDRQSSESLSMNPLTRLLFRSGDYENFLPDEFIYSVGTTGIREGRQLTIVPDTRPDPRSIPPGQPRKDARDEMDMLADHLRQCSDWPAENDERFSRLKQLTAEIIESHNLSMTNEPILIARALEDHFHTPGLYTYTLNFNFARNHELDPIEDFVANHHRGHCQYFASALVLMLRSRGIPARMVVGYRGTEYNEIGDFYQIRQRNAHAWVEMHLTKEQVPDYETTGGEIGTAGAWMRLDPTPSSEATDRVLARDWIGTARDWLDYVDTVWSDYVVGLNDQRQQAAMYGRYSTQSDPFTDAEAWREKMRTLASWFGIHIEQGKNWRVAFDWRAGLTAMILCGLGLVFSRLVKWVWPRIDWSPLAFWRVRQGRRSPVPFYARLEDLLARLGRSRRPAETPLEFVEHAIRELALAQGDSLSKAVDAFYRVRFGGATLDNSEIDAIEHALAELERRPLVGA